MVVGEWFIWTVIYMKGQLFKQINMLQTQDHRQLQNKYRQFKLTKPELFRSSFIDLQSRCRPWHEKKYDFTDFFNYGFNEHTLQIYAHKITKLSEKYSNSIKKEYIEKCENPVKEWHRVFIEANSLKRLTREYNPIDLGGMFIPGDDQLMKINFETEGDEFLNAILFEKNELNELVLGDLKSQYLCSSEQIVFRNNKFHEIKERCKSRIEQMIEENDNLYLFDEAAKVFPEPKQDLPIDGFSSTLFQQIIKLDPTILLPKKEPEKVAHKKEAKSHKREKDYKKSSKHSKSRKHEKRSRSRSKHKKEKSYRK